MLHRSSAALRRRLNDVGYLELRGLDVVTLPGWRGAGTSPAAANHKCTAVVSFSCHKQLLQNLQFRMMLIMPKSHKHSACQPTSSPSLLGTPTCPLGTRTGSKGLRPTPHVTK